MVCLDWCVFPSTFGMHTPLAANAIEMLMKRETNDGRVFQFGSKSDKGKENIYPETLQTSSN